MVVRAFLPERMTTTPPATSPWPSSSAMPRRSSGPIWTVATSRERDAAKVVQGPQVAARAHHVLGFGQLDDRAAGGLVGLLQCLHHGRLRDAEGAHAVGIEHHLVLAHHAADARYLGNVRYRFQLELQEPVVERSQLTQVPGAAAVDERVLVDPAHAGRVGAEGRIGACRQTALYLIEIFHDTRPGPVRIGLVVEQDVDEGVAEERITAHGLCARDAQHRRRQWIGDEILDDLRRLARKWRAHDHLRVREVGEGVERRLRHRPQACGDQERRGDQDQEAVNDRPSDQGGDHFTAPVTNLRTSTSS
jgi:hypothetical protein